MHTYLHTRFQDNLKNYIRKSENILVAISGGQDSLCLLKLLSDCFYNEKRKIHAVYIDHQWKEDSVFHIKHMINIIQANKISLTIYQTKTLKLSENKARQMRYKLFVWHASLKDCRYILTGHNNNDQVETALYNIIRGTSLNGLTNFTLYKKINSKTSLFRPLINFSRSDITWFCRLFYLPVWSDITNYNLEIKRNRLRYELIPYLHNYFNPQFQTNFNKFIIFCKEDHEYIQENTIKLYIKSINNKQISLNLFKLQSQHRILQKRVIKLFFYYHFQTQIHEELINQLMNIWPLNLNIKITRKKLLIYCYHNQIYICKENRS